ncbi:MAG: LamG domain-containing protein, partial [Planctomycetota bacterium]
MRTKSACLIHFMLVFAAAGAAEAVEPGLVGWWRFDDGSGTIARDSSGNGHDGILKGDPQWVEAKTDLGLELDGNGDYVEVGGVGISGMAVRTIAGWAKATTTNISSWTTVFGFAPDGSADGTYFDIEVDDSGNYVVNVEGWQGAFGPVDTQWHHFAATFSGTGGSWYLDGRLVDSVDGDVGTIDQFVIGARLSDSNFFPGVVDDIRVYDRALELDDIKKVMAGPRSYDPFPADGGIYEDAWVSLTWFAGEGAISHDVYLGDNLDDVNVGAAETFQGNQAELYFAAGFPPNAFPEGLVPDTTYYWRIDEVRADGVTIQRGDVWNFTIPSMIAHDPDPPDGAEFVEPHAVFAWTPGFEAKLHTIYVGANFDDVNSASGGMPWGFATYIPAGLEPEKVYYWRVDEFDGAEMYKGDIW